MENRSALRLLRKSMQIPAAEIEPAKGYDILSAGPEKRERATRASGLDCRSVWRNLTSGGTVR